MNVLLILLIALAALAAGYVLYGGLLARKWNLSSRHTPPAISRRDDFDYIPSRKEIIFSHQLASIADGGLVTGTVQAAIFGWVPVLLWLVLGSIFLGGVQNFAALYTSVRSKGRTLGAVLEGYIGRWGKRLFLGFVWVCAVLVIAAFVDMVSQTFCGRLQGGLYSETGGRAASITLLLMAMSILLGLVTRFGKLGRGTNELVTAAILISSILLGLMFPLHLRVTNWYMILFVYILVSASTPVWLLLQPRNYINARVILIMLGMAVVGLLLAHPQMQLEAFRGFTVDGQALFPYLFVTGACGAVSGYHAMVSSATTSKMIRNEERIKPVAYGSMLLCAAVAVVVLLVVGGASGELTGDPISAFGGAVASFFTAVGLPADIVSDLISFGVCTLILSTLDTLTRVGRTVWQELLAGERAPEAEGITLRQVLTNKYAAAVITIAPAIVLSQLGYKSIWPVFGGVNLWVGAISLLACVLFLRRTKRKSVFVLVPLVIVSLLAAAALVYNGWTALHSLIGGSASILGDGFRLLFAVLPIGIAVYILVQALRLRAGRKVTQ